MDRLLSELAEIDAQLDAVLAHDELTDDQRAEHDRLVKDREKKLAAVERQKLAQARADERARLQEEADQRRAAEERQQRTVRPNRITQPDLPAPRGPQAAETAPAQPAQKPFRSLGEQLQAVAQASMTSGQQVHPGLVWKNLAVSGASANVPSDGGYLIEKDFQRDLLRRMYEIGPVMQRVRRIPISSNADGLKLLAVDETSRATGSRWGGVQVYWGAEADSATAKKPKLRQMELELKELIGLAYITNRLLQDASAIEAVFSQAFSEEMSFMVENAIFNGTGAGQPLGVLNSGAVVSVAKETGQAATTLVYENVVKMWSRMWSRSRPNAVWYINQDVEKQLHTMVQTIGTAGVPVYLPANGISGQPYGTLFGRPVVPVEYLPTLGTTGDIFLIDFSQYVMIEKGGMQADESIHVRFINNENTYRFIYRVDGQPVWNTALTPFAGTQTLSPYVKLDTRS